MRAINWSLGLERKLPGAIYAGANFLQKRASDGFVYANQGPAGALSGTYLLTNARQDHYTSEEIEARRTFANGYKLFAAYTHSSARTNAALDYQARDIAARPAAEWSTALGYTQPRSLLGMAALTAAEVEEELGFRLLTGLAYRLPFRFRECQSAGGGGSRLSQVPRLCFVNPGLEWRFHFRGSYFGLRGVMENATNRNNPAIVNNNVDSPEFGTFSEFEGRAFTARIRLIGSK